ncbi:hypothetical protein Tco_0857406 [Tanacetum coccineum]|uniref:Uncharacterized protein n=1 Tax=Tanacetum coccineum TaxID=301880 RepID=A0ABQ5BAE3_9ASTR
MRILQLVSVLMAFSTLRVDASGFYRNAPIAEKIHSGDRDTHRSVRTESPYILTLGHLISLSSSEEIVTRHAREILWDGDG